MPVVINDFEVVPSQPVQRQEGDAAVEVESAPAEKPDYRQLQRHWREREERVRAH